MVSTFLGQNTFSDNLDFEHFLYDWPLVPSHEIYFSLDFDNTLPNCATEPTDVLSQTPMMDTDTAPSILDADSAQHLSSVSNTFS
jgi:hypothetical protein